MKVVTQETVQEALSQGLKELILQPGTIVTLLAREHAQDKGVRLVQSSALDPGAAVAAAVSEAAVSDTTALRDAVIQAVGHAPAGLDDAVASVLGNQPEAATPSGSAPKSSSSFEATLLERAKAGQRNIVLCEGTEERILKAVGILLAAGACRITLLGDEKEIRDKARAVGVDLGSAEIIDPMNSQLTSKFAAEYARLRAHKGVTAEEAVKRIVQVSYFGTMMVQQGLADGMVSGAVHTTAETIRPALEIIKTTSDVSSVSSAFFMVQGDEVLVFGDCAVNPNPTAQHLAETAMLMADAAVSMGVEPRVAMLSYSTGTSGAGPDVELVGEATELAKQKTKYPVDGPMQYDAAVDSGVADRKLPGSKVGGKATVMVFPDLNSGNIAYKAVQQSAGALAVGPVLLGLRKPVNDLSRGATVDDIVNTIAITAIQAAT